MNYEDTLKEFLSTCDGVVRNVFFNLYSIIESFDEQEQPAAVMYICENIYRTKSDFTRKIEREYYTEEQLKKAIQKINKKLSPALDQLVDECAKNSVEPIEFYARIWKLIQSSFFATKRERALALFSLVDHDLIPYRSVGVGLTMEDEEYRRIVDSLEKRVIKDTEYILELEYDQKTQQASLLVEKLLSLDSKEEQAVYMALIINQVENNIREEIKAAIDDV